MSEIPIETRQIDAYYCLPAFGLLFLLLHGYGKSSQKCPEISSYVYD